MDAINRSAIIVMPAQPFLDWLHRADPTSATLSLEDLRREPTIYLLPEYDTEQEARGYLREYCSEIFEEQLDGWYRVPSAWPVDRTFDTFNRWFEYRFHSMLVDLCDEPVIHDEI
jgi:hypothetical protein